MSAFKKLNRQDVFLTSYSAKKQWNVSGSSLSDLEVQGVKAVSGSTVLFTGSAQYTGSLYHQSIKHLYYGDFLSNYTQSGSRDHYMQSSLISGARQLEDTAFIISLPRSIVGSYIEPGTFNLTYQSTTLTYIESGYVESGYVE